MDTTPYVDALLADLESMAALGDDAVADAARRLSQTFRSSAGLRLLDLLGEAALEVSGQLPSGHVEGRPAGPQRGAGPRAAAPARLRRGRAVHANVRGDRRGWHERPHHAPALGGAQD